MQKKDETIFDYRKSKDLLNYQYVIDEQVNGKFTKHSFRTEQTGYVDCYFYRPASNNNAKLPVLINLHGGGFVLGYCEQDGIYCQLLADSCNYCVVNIDYCLAPEFKFPNAIKATYDVVCQIQKRQEEFNIDCSSIALLGHSAGGSIAGAIALLDKDFHKLKIAKVIMDYPLLDQEEFYQMRDAKIQSHAISRILDYINWYLPNPIKDVNNPLASPLKADLSGLPSMFILGAEMDPLCKQGKAFYQKAKRQKSDVYFKCYRGCNHGFTHKWLSEYNKEKSEEAWSDIADFLQNKKIVGAL